MEDKRQEKRRQIDRKLAQLDEEYDLRKKDYHNDLEKLDQLYHQIQRDFQEGRDRAVAAMAEVDDKQKYIRQSNIIAMRSNEILSHIYHRRRQKMDDEWEEYSKENKYKREELLEKRRNI